MEEITRLKKELIELRAKVNEHEEAMLGVAMLEDKVDEHHDILVNKGSFITYDRIAFAIAIISVVLSLLSIVLQFLI